MDRIRKNSTRVYFFIFFNVGGEYNKHALNTSGNVDIVSAIKNAFFKEGFL